jgi:glycosyltransferase involved in cell wall biosynthesis
MSTRASDYSVAFATYPTAFANPGGGEMQMQRTFTELDKAGVAVSYLNTHKPWDAQAIDMLHLFSVCNSMELFANICLEKELPYVLSPILWPGDYPEPERNRIRHILLNASVILTNSATETATIRQKMCIPEEVRFHEVVNGVDTEVFRRIARCKETIDPEVVLSIANIEPRKNQLALLEACLSLGKSLHIAGHARDLKYLESLRQLGGKRFIYHGPIKHGGTEHMQLLARSAVFALPSLYETPGLSALEAGVAGLPIAITSVGSTADYFGENAFYCAPDEFDSIRNALEAAFAGPFTTPESVRDRLSAFTWKRAAEETKAAYQSVSNLNQTSA